MPRPTASTSGPASRASSIASTIASISSPWSRPSTARCDARVDVELPRRRRRRAAWCRRGRSRSPCASCRGHSGTIRRREAEQAGAAGEALACRRHWPMPDGRQARIPRLPLPPGLPEAALLPRPRARFEPPKKERSGAPGTAAGAGRRRGSRRAGAGTAGRAAAGPRRLPAARRATIPWRRIAKWTAVGDRLLDRCSASRSS